MPYKVGKMESESFSMNLPSEKVEGRRILNETLIMLSAT